MLAYITDNGKYIAVFLGFLAGTPLVLRRGETFGLKKGGQAVFACLMFSAFSVISAVIFAGFEGAISGKGFGFKAISTYGIYFICPILIMSASKLFGMNVKKTMDVYALYALPSLFFLRINCLLSNCCGGCQIGHTELFWPTRQLEMVFYAAMLFWLLQREKKGIVAGTSFPLLMTSYGGFRFIVEWMRETEGHQFFHLAHWWSLAAFVIGLSIYSELNNRTGPRVKKARGKERY